MMLLKNKFEDMLLQGEYEKVLAEIDQVDIQSHQQQRIMLHIKAQALIFVGDLEGAKSNLNMAERHFGENISVLRDLANLYYQTGETHQWRVFIAALQKRLQDVAEKLKPETHVQCLVSLGKFYEEEGDIFLAGQHYESAWELTPLTSESLKILVLIQQLRLKSLYIAGSEVGSWYSKLIAINPKSLSFDLEIELSHSLMLAELELVGPQHAWKRVKQIVDSVKVCRADKRLAVGDYVAESLLRNLSLSDEIKQTALLFLGDGDSFEQELKKMLTDSSMEVPSAHEMSWACYLRLLTIHFQRSNDEGLKQEIFKKLNLLLNSQTPSSRYLWLKRIQPVIVANKSVMDVHSIQRTVHYQGKTVDLSKKRTIFSLFTLMAQKPEVEVEALIKSLWDSDYSLEHVHRLRMTVHRTNQVLFDLCAIPKALEMTQDKVSLNSDLKMKLIN